MLSFFPRDVLDEILNLIESVFEGFPSYSFNLSTLKPLGSLQEQLSFAEKTDFLKTSTGKLFKIDGESTGYHYSTKCFID